MEKQETITLKDRLKTKDDYLIITIVYIIYITSFIALFIIPDPVYGGMVIALRFAFIFAIFPGGLLAGL